MSQFFANPESPTRPLHVTDTETLESWCATHSETFGPWVQSTGFAAQAGETLLLPGPDGRVAGAIVGLGTAKDKARRRFTVAAARSALPEGAWTLHGNLTGPELDEAALGWLLASDRYGRYVKTRPPKAELIAPEGVDARRLEIIAAGELLTRGMINTPASDMGPNELEGEVRTVAERHGAAVKVTTGDALLRDGFPMIHAVGRAADEAPRLIEMTWGTAGPRLTLVGKGVCFDTGGLNLKPASSMGLMKKDMGGAATVLGLAQMIMALGLPLRLRVLIPAVENAVAGNSFRPGDILTSRKGLTVEINNTDAEGRLVLADALALAGEEPSDLTISMATLTGAARVAVGPDLAPFYCDDDAIAGALLASGGQVRDPLWRMPFWTPYETMIEPGIADLDNAPSGGFAGSITAALFLRRFAGPAPYVHFDIYGWNPTAAPARPKGGVGMGARAILAALPGILQL